MYLLTCHGTFLCRPDANGVIAHQSLSTEGAVPLDIDLPGPPHQSSLHHAELGVLRVEAQPGTGAIHLLRENFYMCADGNTGQVLFDRTAPAAWESFLPVSAQDAADLGLILGYRWIVRESRRVIRRNQIGVRDNFTLHIGPYAVDLATGLGTLATQRGENGLPVALTLTHLGAQIELVVAEPRSSALVQTEMWPPRARRVAEILAFAVHRHITGLEPAQEVFERDARFLQEKQGAAGLEDLLESLAPGLPDATAPLGAGVRDVLMGWAVQEVIPWQFKPVSHADAKRVFESFNESRSWIVVFEIAGGEVVMKAKPGHLALAALQLERAEKYLAFLRAVAPLLPTGFSTTLCMGLGDALPSSFEVPVFSFQKRAGWNNILLPDIDFLMHDFYDMPELRDDLAYEEKQPGAVFAGGTTGGLITPAVARDLSLPRLRAAQYFVDHPMVDFRLPAISQCTTPEAEELLRAQPFCQKPPLGWQEQFHKRMVISMDGNGATCSRVVIALRSQSVLLKYASDHVLYYFGGMQPWVHYVPVGNDSDIDRLVEMEARDPALFARIAANGQAFARTYLNAESARHYTAMLLQLYEASFSDSAAPLAAPMPPRVHATLPAGEESYILAHVQNRGDKKAPLGSWIGERDSTLAIEGFAISLGTSLPATGFTYQAVMANGVLSEAAQPGEYRGTRGENLPTYGVLITLDDDFVSQYDVEYEATFIDGAQVGPVRAGTICAAPSQKQMESLRVTISERTE